MATRSTLPNIVVTAGEPAGIGPDLCVALATIALPARITIIGDADVIAARAEQLKQSINIKRGYANKAHQGHGEIHIQHISASKNVIAGKLNAGNSQYVLNTLDEAILHCQQQEASAMVTAPVHKGIINDAGITFTGHTEYLAEKTQTPQVVMMLVGGGMRVALATTHIPLAKVSQAITQSHLTKTIEILHHDLVDKFGIQQPRILVTGLNPHAGEGGHLGEEEIHVINPVLKQLRAQGMDISDAMPADTLFSQHNINACDAFLAMYHDQGLTVLKHASFGNGVNLTLGLPIIRTSVDHGTALDIAGTGKATLGSLLAATELAIQLANQQQS